MVGIKKCFEGIMIIVRNQNMDCILDNSILSMLNFLCLIVMVAQENALVFRRYRIRDVMMKWCNVYN